MLTLQQLEDFRNLQMLTAMFHNNMAGCTTFHQSTMQCWLDQAERELCYAALASCGITEFPMQSFTFTIGNGVLDMRNADGECIFISVHSGEQQFYFKDGERIPLHKE